MMKSRTSIIIGITTLATVLLILAFVYSEQQIKEEIWIGGEDYCGDYCNQEELRSMGCDYVILKHIWKYTDVLEDEFDGIHYSLDWISFPEGVTEDKLQQCIDEIIGQRMGTHHSQPFGLTQEGMDEQRDIEPIYTEHQW